MLRGPIRRRPYNRGEIVAKNAGEMGVFYDFYSCLGQEANACRVCACVTFGLTRALAGSGRCIQPR